jgi:hypothetical protein
LALERFMPDLQPGYNLIRMPFIRHCEPTGRANARPMTGSAKQSMMEP